MRDRGLLLAKMIRKVSTALPRREQGLEANTRADRGINRLRITHRFKWNKGWPLDFAVTAVRGLVSRQQAPNWGKAR